MSKRLLVTTVLISSFFGAIIALGAYKYFEEEEQPKKQATSFTEKQNYRLSNFLDEAKFTIPKGINFIYAAERATPGVVHIKSTYDGSARGYASQSPLEEMFKDFFGEDDRRQYYHRRNPERSFGSGVIISPDGYIATNNHVIDNANQVEVTLWDNRRFTANVVGVDPTTDLALIKIDENQLQYIPFGNSDEVKIGEWVLAVGNPFDLTSTVTAGIVSAMARNINILRGRTNYSIEAFIQTDAAVNPGNSGGALVNLKGELIGLNTAIATPTGSYAGYSFAVPSSLVKKVMDDLLEFGVVQRALLGITIIDVDADLAEDQGLEQLSGVYVSSVGAGSAADDAGIKVGDVIVEIEDTEVNNVAKLQEMVARNRPGDQITVTLIRDRERKKVNATLKNINGDTRVVKKVNAFSIAGATFAEIKEEEKTRLKIDGGVQIIELEDGKWRDAGIKEGFIITSIDKKDIQSIDDIKGALDDKQGGILIEGIYPNGKEAFYGIGW